MPGICTISLNRSWLASWSAIPAGQVDRRSGGQNRQERHDDPGQAAGCGHDPDHLGAPEYVRELRALIHHRQRLISQQTRIKNQLQSLLHRHHLVPPGGKLFGATNRAWWLGLGLTSSEKLRLRQDLILLDQLDPLISEVETEINRLSLAEPWADLTPYLLQLPGIGLITAMTILSAIGEIERFPTAKAGRLRRAGAKVHSSGLTHRTGGITKQGRKELRRVLIEAA
ncbi:MAG: transposase [Anaerolineales bacterium]|nr:transposase [Anaerolineales bacterium]